MMRTKDFKSFFLPFYLFTFKKIFVARKILSRREVFEVHFAEYHALITPPCHILLPLRYDVMRICRVSVGLRIGIYCPPDMIVAKIL